MSRKRLFAALLTLLMAVSAAYAQDEVTSAYQFAMGDLIAISVYQEPDLSFQVRVSESGIVDYPFIGDVQLIGKTAAEVALTIRERLISGEFLVDPKVSINVVQYRPFYIEGQVRIPGTYPFEPGLTVRKAISIAGSFTERASRSNITIMRNSSEVDPADDILDEPIQPDDVITVAERFF